MSGDDAAIRPPVRRGARPSHGTGRRQPSGLGVVAWFGVAAIVVVGRHSLPRLVSSAPSAPVTHAPVLVLGDWQHAPVRVLAERPAPIAVAARPFDALAPFRGRLTPSFASPLITPRLFAGVRLLPRLAALRGLLARARPGEPVEVTLTAYCLQGTTARGATVRTGIVAADPTIFPLARHVEIYAAGRFLGRFLVDDTGGGVRGTHLDIWTPDCDDARDFGRRRGVATLVARD